MTNQRSVARDAWRLALCLVAIAPGAISAQTIPDRLEIHGSLNAAYGRAQELPVVGVPLTGTSDYRVFTLQGRYKLTDDDQIVAQVFNRRLGSSPLAGAISDVVMQWAYYQHRMGDATIKVGRSPLPRGLSNETRYIGTVHPFFRPPSEVQQEGFDALDGAVLGYRHELFGGIELEQFGFAGGSESRVIANTTTGQELRLQRTENMIGLQTNLRFPVAGLRLAAYGTRYDLKTVGSAATGSRTNVLYSLESTPIERIELKSEYSRVTGVGPANDTRAFYVQTMLRLTDRVSLGGQHSILDRMLFFTNSDMNFVLPDVKTDGASVIFHLTNNSVLKAEHHWRSGWTYDVPTPPIAAQTATDVTLSSRPHSRYYLVSIAASF